MSDGFADDTHETSKDTASDEKVDEITRTNEVNQGRCETVKHIHIDCQVKKTVVREQAQEHGQSGSRAMGAIREIAQEDHSSWAMMANEDNEVASNNGPENISCLKGSA